MTRRNNKTEKIRVFHPSRPPVNLAPYALKTEVPTPAVAAPPAVAVASGMGSTPSSFAMEDHTHASKVRRQIVAIPAASTYTWVYPTAFAAGVVPMVSAIAQVGAGTTDLFNIQVVGAPTNTQCVFQINRASAGLLALLLGALSINPTPAAITLHMVALEP